jgi:hypothetical protein
MARSGVNLKYRQYEIEHGPEEARLREPVRLLDAATRADELRAAGRQNVKIFDDQGEEVAHPMALKGVKVGGR